MLFLKVKNYRIPYFFVKKENLRESRAFDLWPPKRELSSEGSQKYANCETHVNKIKIPEFRVMCKSKSFIEPFLLEPELGNILHVAFAHSPNGSDVQTRMDNDGTPLLHQGIGAEGAHCGVVTFKEFADSHLFPPCLIICCSSIEGCPFTAKKKKQTMTSEAVKLSSQQSKIESSLFGCLTLSPSSPLINLKLRIRWMPRNNGIRLQRTAQKNCSF